MLGGAAFHAAQKLKARLLAIAAHDLKIPLERATYDAGHVFDRVALQNRKFLPVGAGGDCNQPHGLVLFVEPMPVIGNSPNQRVSVIK